jgi:polyisoprenoid-binding protein YceI
MGRFWAVCAGVAALLTMPWVYAATVPYVLDQRYCTIEFATSGFIAAQGYFQHVTGHLDLDFQHPENSRINVTVDDTALTVSPAFAAETLRSPAYFDSAKFPTVAFRSLSVAKLSETEFKIHGMLTMRGVTREQDMTAQLISTPAASNTADFYVAGTLRRADFGMVADQLTVSNLVRLRIHARVEKAP